MTELEKIRAAKTYIDKLAEGVNPLDDSVIPDNDIVNNVHLSRCFFYVSDVLRKVIENGGVISGAANGRNAKQPFYLTPEKRKEFNFSSAPIPVSEITERMNQLIDANAMRRISTTSVTQWLVSAGMLAVKELQTGRTTKRPTQLGESIGISIEERQGVDRIYQVVLYNKNAQEFILDNLDAMLSMLNEKTELQGTKWTQEQDKSLRDMYNNNVPESEIALTLKRKRSAIRSRLKKLGLLPY